MNLPSACCMSNFCFTNLHSAGCGTNKLRYSRFFVHTSWILQSFCLGRLKVPAYDSFWQTGTGSDLGQKAKADFLNVKYSRTVSEKDCLYFSLLIYLLNNYLKTKFVYIASCIFKKVLSTELYKCVNRYLSPVLRKTLYIGTNFQVFVHSESYVYNVHIPTYLTHQSIIMFILYLHGFTFLCHGIHKRLCIQRLIHSYPQNYANKISNAYI